MGKWLIGIAIMLVSFMSFGQALPDTSSIESSDAVGAMFQLMSKLLVDKPSLSLVILVVTQVVIIILRAKWLDDTVGRLKMLIISGVAILIPACTFFISNPSSQISQVLADGATLAALQVFGHQMFQHFFGAKKNSVRNLKDDSHGSIPNVKQKIEPVKAVKKTVRKQTHKKRK